MITIHLIRHAEAVERSEEIPEEHRFLTCRGRSRFRKVASSLKKMGVEPDVILTSPLIRAVQTAEILAQMLNHRGYLQVTPLLAPGFGSQALDELLSKYPQAGEFAFIGHEPDLGELARTLLKAKDVCTLKKGAVISFRRASGHGDRTDFMQLVGTSGKVIASRDKALQRLLHG